MMARNFALGALGVVMQQVTKLIRVVFDQYHEHHQWTTYCS